MISTPGVISWKSANSTPGANLQKGRIRENLQDQRTRRALLDLAVAKAEGWGVSFHSGDEASDRALLAVAQPGVPTLRCAMFAFDDSTGQWTHAGVIPFYSTSWAHDGPVIEGQRLQVMPEYRDGPWYAGRRSVAFGFEDREIADAEGPTPLIAAMRAYVASKFGRILELPI